MSEDVKPVTIAGMMRDLQRRVAALEVREAERDRVSGAVFVSTSSPARQLAGMLPSGVFTGHVADALRSATGQAERPVVRVVDEGEGGR